MVNIQELYEAINQGSHHGHHLILRYNKCNNINVITMFYKFNDVKSDF